MNEANGSPNRKSPDNRPTFPKRQKPHDSAKPSSRASSAPESRSRKATSVSEQPSSSPVAQRPPSVPGWQVVEFPSIISEAAKPQPPHPAKSTDTRSKSAQLTKPSSSQPARDLPQSSAPVRPPTPEALIALIQDANQRNHALLNRIVDLEGALEESRQALQNEVERASDDDEVPPSQSNPGTSQQVNYLLNQLEFSQQTSQRQEILIETLTGQLQTSQERVGQIEYEYQQLQDQAKDSTSELSQVRSQCRELQMRLQRQQRYTLQFKAALEKCLEVPPPSYETGYTAPSRLPNRNGEEIGEEITEELSFKPEIPQEDLPENISQARGETGHGTGQPSDRAYPKVTPAEELTQAAETTGVGFAETPATQPLPINMPSLFPKTDQIRPWSAPDAEPDLADPTSSRIPLGRELEPETSVENAPGRSPSAPIGLPSKFHDTLMELAHVDLVEASPQPSVSDSSPATIQATPQTAPQTAPDTLAEPDLHVLSQESDAAVVPEEPTSEPLPQSSSEPQAIAMPEAPATPQRMPSQATGGLVLPPDLRKERSATPPHPDRPDVAADVPRNSSPLASQADSTDPLDFPASFSILGSNTGDGSTLRSDSERVDSDDAESGAATLDGLWRDLAHLVDASTDDILKAKHTEVFEPSTAETNRLSESDASILGGQFETSTFAEQESGIHALASDESTTTPATKRADAAIAKNQIPPFSVPQSKPAKTEATLTALAQQPNWLSDPWLEPESEPLSEADGDRQIDPSLASSPMNPESPLEAAEPELDAQELQAQGLEAQGLEAQGLEAQESQAQDLPTAASQDEPLQAQGRKAREAQLPNLAPYYVDDWVSHSPAATPAPQSATPPKSGSDVSAPSSPQANPQPSSQPPAQANSPAPLLDPKRTKPNKTTIVDLPAFLR
ncbi:MAG: hypothetical protein WBA57_17895 [Elainellaceae cyanobacterium]